MTYIHKNYLFCVKRNFFNAFFQVKDAQARLDEAEQNALKGAHPRL